MAELANATPGKGVLTIGNVRSPLEDSKRFESSYDSSSNLDLFKK